MAAIRVKKKKASTDYADYSDFFEKKRYGPRVVRKNL
jgi:hypothetical protein